MSVALRLLQVPAGKGPVSKFRAKFNHLQGAPFQSFTKSESFQKKRQQYSSRQWLLQKLEGDSTAEHVV